jgi:hypothetical protein
MRAYLVYKDKSVKGFKHLINAGGGIFDNYRTLAVSFIRYASSDLDSKLAEYDKELMLNGIKLEQIFPSKYRWFVNDVSFRTSRQYLKSLEERITEFQNGKEDNLKLLVGVLFLRFVLITKLVETYCSSAVNIKKAGGNVDDLTFEDIGITNQILKHYVKFQDIGEKSIDDWLNMKVDQTAAKHFYSSMKRILKILMSTDER